MKLISRFTSIVGLMVLMCLSLAYADDVRITIDEGIDSAQPIAVVPFRSVAGIPTDIAQIIADDLRNSGKFSPISVSRMPEQPTTANEVSPAKWTDVGIDNVVVGQISTTSAGYNIAYQLIDTLGVSGAAGNVIAQGSFIVPVAQIRQGAHTISDQIFEKLTNIRGAFRTKIAYVVQRGVSAYELRISDYDGFNAFTVVKSKEPLMSPAWSPDGQYLAYVTFENKKSQLVLHNIQSGTRRVIAAFKGHNGAPAFSPDGTRIAFASNKDGVLNIYTVGFNGGTPVQLTSSAGNNTEPSWSPDGASIVFTSDRSGSPRVYRMDSSGSAVTAIGNSGSYNAQISSDGKNIIMISGDKIVKQDIVSGNSEVLSSTFLDENPSLSPNGIMIIYSSTKGMSKVLQLVSADGRFKANLPGAGGQFKFPAWSPYLTK